MSVYGRLVEALFALPYGAQRDAALNLLDNLQCDCKDEAQILSVFDANVDELDLRALWRSVQ